jgi:hypothetical protein
MTARRIAWAATALTVLLGLGHLSLLLLAKRWSPDAAWFAGTGLAIITAALLNVAALRHPGDRLVRAAAVFGNLLLLGFSAALWTVAPEPQVAICGALFLALAGLVLTRRVSPA